MSSANLTERDSEGVRTPMSMDLTRTLPWAQPSPARASLQPPESWRTAWRSQVTCATHAPKKVEEKKNKTTENQAAVKIQAAVRGRQGRKLAAVKKVAAMVAKAFKKAAVKIQAAERSRQSRKKVAATVKSVGRSVKKQIKNILMEAMPIFLNTTINKMHEIKIASPADLQGQVEAIFEMIVDDTVDDQENCSKHARCGETFADLMLALRMVAPTFDTHEDKPVTFTRVLLNVTQDSFEEEVAKFSNAEKAKEMTMTAVHRLIAVTSFIGHLYIRRLVAARVIAQVVHDLIGVRERLPDKNLIICVCELLLVIGSTVDANKQGQMLMMQFLARLNNLAASKKRDTEEAIYPQEIRDCIRAVHIARADRWPSRPGTQVLLQYHVVSEEEARKIWKQLQEQKQLPVDQMEWDGPKAVEGEGEHIRLSTVISGSNIAVMFSKSLATLEEKSFKDEISALTSIHPQRLMVFRPDLTLVKDATVLVATCSQ